MWVSVFLACAGISAVFAVYMGLLSFNAGGSRENENGTVELSPAVSNGQSAGQLERLPKVIGKDLELGNDYAVCLDEIDDDEPARLVPGCNHGFHLQCANTWLLRNPVCPVCRARLGPELFSSDENPCLSSHPCWQTGDSTASWWTQELLRRSSPSKISSSSG